MKNQIVIVKLGKNKKRVKIQMKKVKKIIKKLDI